MHPQHSVQAEEVFGALPEVKVPLQPVAVLALPVVMCVAPCPGADGEAEQVLYMVKPSSHCEAL